MQTFDNAPRVKWSQIILISLCFSILPHKTADQIFLLFFVKNVWSNLNQFWGLETFLSAHAAVSSTGFSSPSISGNWKSGLWPLRHLFVSSWLRILKSKKEQENKLVGSPFFPSLLSHGFREKASQITQITGGQCSSVNRKLFFLFHHTSRGGLQWPSLLLGFPNLRD